MMPNFVQKCGPSYKKRRHSHDDPGEDLCDPEWTGHAGYCYLHSSMATNWADAQKQCQINYHGANLISIHSDEDRRFLSSV